MEEVDRGTQRASGHLALLSPCANHIREVDLLVSHGSRLLFIAHCSQTGNIAALDTLQTH